MWDGRFGLHFTFIYSGKKMQEFGLTHRGKEKGHHYLKRMWNAMMVLSCMKIKIVPKLYQCTKYYTKLNYEGLNIVLDIKVRKIAFCREILIVRGVGNKNKTTPYP